MIDPIDGTGSWLNGLDGFVTQLAYIENNILGFYNIVDCYGKYHSMVLPIVIFCNR